MDGKCTLKICKVSFVTKDGTELSKEQLTDEQFQTFCDEVEKSRLERGIVWPELDSRYGK